MTLAKTCYASNVMQDSKSNSYCNHKSCLNRDVSIVPLLYWKKIESHLETGSSDAQRMILTFFAHSFVANLLSYILTKHYENWSSSDLVIVKTKG